MVYSGVAMCLVLTGVPENQKRGIEVLKREAERGNEFAITNLASLYARGAEGIEKNPPAALELLESAVRRGSIAAKARLGSMLLRGETGIADSVRAESLMREAADAGEVSSQYSLFIQYRRGGDLPKNLAQSDYYWRLLQKNSDPMAAQMIVFGNQYLAREQQDFKKLQATAETGDADAQFSLGKLLLEAGKPEEALKWFQEAAKQDSVLAMVELAQMYEQPLGTDKDAGRATDLLRQAAERGYPGAQNLLADKYFHGSGVEKSIPDAMYWLKVAELLGSEKAANRFRVEASQLSPGTVKAAQDRAAAFIKSHPEFPKQEDGTYIREVKLQTVPSPPKKD
jgi:uncharacterized protein